MSYGFDWDGPGERDHEYPRPQELIVGISPCELRQFRPPEVLALLEAFEALTGVDPLAEGADLPGALRAARWSRGDI